MATTTEPRGSDMTAANTTVRDVLARDLGQKIESVVKVYDKSHLAEDLRDFVITDSLAAEMRKFLDDFTSSPRTRMQGGDAGDGMAVWLWGFSVSYTHLRAHETRHDLVCRLL